MKQKIFHIIHDIKIGGVENAVLSSISRVNDCYDYYVVSIGKINNEVFSNLEIKSKKKIIFINCPTPLYLPIAILKFTILVWRQKPLLIISSLWKSHLCILFSQIFLTFKHITFIHSTKTFHLIDKFVTYLILSKSKVVFVDSIATKAVVDKKFLHTSDSQTISMLLYKSKKIKNYKNEVNSVYKLVFIGRLIEYKRIDKLIQFVHIACQKGIFVHLDIIGPIEMPLDNFLDTILKLDLKDHIKILPPTNNSFELLVNYDFYISLSDLEGLGMSTVEAMSVGLIPLITNVGDAFNYAIDGYNAIVITPNQDVSVLVHKLWVNIIENKLPEISFNAVNSFKNYPTFSEDYLSKIKQYV